MERDFMKDRPYFVQIGLGADAECAQLIRKGWYGALVEVDPLSFALCHEKIARDPALRAHLSQLHWFNLAVAGDSCIREFSTYTFDRTNNIPQWSHTQLLELDLLATDMDQRHHAKKETCFGVMTVALDEFLNYLDGPVDWLMLDVEGMEFELLENLKRNKALATLPRCIQLEYHDTYQKACREILYELGYAPVLVYKNGNTNEKWLLLSEHDAFVASEESIFGYHFNQEQREQFEREMLYYELTVASRPRD